MSTRFVKWLLQRNLEKMRKNGNFIFRCGEVKVTRRLRTDTRREGDEERRESKQVVTGACSRPERSS